MFKKSLGGLAETSEALIPRSVRDTAPGTEPDWLSLTNRPAPSIGDNVSTVPGAP